jgi:hypothetical protein
MPLITPRAIFAAAFSPFRAIIACRCRCRRLPLFYFCRRHFRFDISRRLSIFAAIFFHAARHCHACRRAARYYFAADGDAIFFTRDIAMRAMRRDTTALFYFFRTSAIHILRLPAMPPRRYWPPRQSIIFIACRRHFLSLIIFFRYFFSFDADTDTLSPFSPA